VVSRFLQKHDMDLICRAHQVVEDGYEFFSKRQLVTLFSAPNYCGEFDNAGAMMSVDESLLCSFQVRFLRFLYPVFARLTSLCWYRFSNRPRRNKSTFTVAMDCRRSPVTRARNFLKRRNMDTNNFILGSDVVDCIPATTATRRLASLSTTLADKAVHRTLLTVNSHHPPIRL